MCVLQAVGPGPGRGGASGREQGFAADVYGSGTWRDRKPADEEDVVAVLSPSDPTAAPRRPRPLVLVSVPGGQLWGADEGPVLRVRLLSGPVLSAAQRTPARASPACPGGRWAPGSWAGPGQARPVPHGRFRTGTLGPDATCGEGAWSSAPRPLYSRSFYSRWGKRRPGAHSLFNLVVLQTLSNKEPIERAWPR